VVTLSAPSPLVLPADAVAIAPALFLPVDIPPLLHLFLPRILPRLFLQPCYPGMEGVSQVLISCWIESPRDRAMEEEGGSSFLPPTHPPRVIHQPL
jgi:hypothetical protein